jgi:nucleoside-diphosphate-sugar epimerase
MQILIIGGFGYIGSQLLESIAAHEKYRNCNIVVVDNWSYGRGMAPLQALFESRLPHFHSYCLDFSEPGDATFRDLVKSSDFIINVASLTQVPSTNLHEKYIIDGVRVLTELLTAENAGKLRKVIDISSTSIYGPVRTRMPDVTPPYSEQVYPDPAVALHNYAASKLVAEKIWQSDRCQGLPFTVFRLSTVFGYAVGMRYNQFINQFLVDAAAGRRTILPGSPDNIRPFVHIRDTADLMLHLLEQAPQTNGEILNIGAARLNPRLGDLFERLSALLSNEFGLKPDYAFAADLGQPTLEESYQVDFSKFEKLVSFPLRHDFESGARELLTRVLGRA